MDIMSKIVELLTLRGLEQKDICDAIGVKRSVFSDWKSG